MKPARIFKDNIRENVLRSLLFTNQVIIGIMIVVIAGVNFVIFQTTPLKNLPPSFWGNYITSVIFVGLFIITPLLFKTDGQPVYMLIPRGIKHLLSNKKQTAKNIHPYFSNFHIQDNTIFRQSSLTRIFQIEPKDIALLSDQDKLNFYEGLRTMLHMLPIKTQFIVRREIATSKDFTQHFYSMYKESNNEREDLIQGYIHGLKQFIDDHTFLISKHYAVFSIECNTKSSPDIVKGMQKLVDVGARFMRGLGENQITARALNNNEIINFMQKYYR